MNGKGLNVRLLERRLELDYSVREASIRLDITKGYLYAIECGYLKVSKKLRARFIRKYHLPRDFFQNDPYLGYPTPVNLAEPKVKKKSKIGKIFKSLPFKIVTGVLTGGFAAMAIVGLTMQPRLNNDAKSFYAPEITEVKNIVKTKGVEVAATKSHIGTLILDSFYNYSSEAEIQVETKYGTESIRPGLNYFTLDQNLYYTFCTGFGKSNDQFFGGDYWYSFESRNYGDFYRLHFDIYDNEEYKSPSYHISADYNPNNKTFNYKLVEEINGVIHIPLSNYDLAYITTTFECERLYEVFNAATPTFFNEKIKGQGTNIDFNTYCLKFAAGANNEIAYEGLVYNLVLSGIIFGIIFLAMLTLSIIVSLRIDEKVDAVVGMDADVQTNPETVDVPKRELLPDEEPLPELASQVMVEDANYKPLPKNNWLPPVLPEFVIRIITVIILLAGSLGLYFIFLNIVNIDIFGTIDAVKFRAGLSSLITMATLLLFFTKIDIQQNSKNTFKINFILFFAGLAFYFLILIVSYALQSSQSLMSTIGKDLMIYLPGNIVWGILSINLLAAFAFNKPNFSGKTAKTKLIVFRSLIIIPLFYLVFSFIYSALRTYAGWTLPLSVSSIFFSNNPLTVTFALLYVLFVFLCRKWTDKKYGPNAVIYRTGNQYCLIKNLVVVGIIVALAVCDICLAQIPGNPFNSGKDIAILWLIPIVLLYRPHMGYRNVLWDGLFAGMNMVALTIGILMIGYSLFSYIRCV